MAGLEHNLRVHLDVYVGMSETELHRVTLAREKQVPPSVY